jgi:hypothetical protein
MGLYVQAGPLFNSPGGEAQIYSLLPRGPAHLVNFILTITLRMAILQGKPSALGIPFIYCLPGFICLAGYKGKILYNNRAHQFTAHHYFPA